MTCDLCKADNVSTTHLALYLFGSEGINVCHGSKMKLTDYVRKLASEGLNNRKRKFLAKRKKRKEL